VDVGENDAGEEMLESIALRCLARFGASLPYVSRGVLTEYIEACIAIGGAPAEASPAPEELQAFGPLDAAIDDDEWPDAPTLYLKNIDEPALSQAPPRWPIVAPNLPWLETPADVAALVDASLMQLDGWQRHWRDPRHTHPTAQHYHYRYHWQAKASGGARLIAHPKLDLKHAQRRLLTRLIEKVPAHEAAHGFVRGRGALTHAQQHTGKALVLRCDLKDFFLSVRASRIHASFRTLGYNDVVARCLTRIVTSAAPASVLRAGRSRGVDAQAISRYRNQHLPQGAPTSPALANLTAFRMDVRLSALASDMGAEYSRYADDLTLSFAEPPGHTAHRLYHHVIAIAKDEGFAVNLRKTRWMSQATRQSVTGIVTNRAPNVARDEFNRLKATLHNALRNGLAAQNRDGIAHYYAHLCGRVAHACHINPAKGAKLKAMLVRLRG
jgi:RNA-directed DNA polymerase